MHLHHHVYAAGSTVLFTALLREAVIIWGKRRDKHLTLSNALLDEASYLTLDLSRCCTAAADRRPQTADRRPQARSRCPDCTSTVTVTVTVLVLVFPSSTACLPCPNQPIDKSAVHDRSTLFAQVQVSLWTWIAEARLCSDADPNWPPRTKYSLFMPLRLYYLVLIISTLR